MKVFCFVLLLQLHAVSGDRLFDVVFRDHVCYGILGCFSNKAPYTNALDKLPESPEKISVTLTLYTRHEPQRGYALSYTDPMSVLGTGFDPTADTKVIIHGYENDGTEDWMVNMISQFLKRGPFNVIKVAWGPGAHVFYPQAVANTRVVGAVVAHMLTSLQDVYNVSMSRVHLLGHSLGAHIAGYVGQRAHGIARISGMDPAGPLFESASPQVRIDPSDAIFVDCIHSDGLPLRDAGFGTMSAWCDADYYPNGGGLQPGCPKPVPRTLKDVVTFKFPEAFVDVSCSHSRSHDYYVDSINTCRFPSTPCTSYDNFTAGKCTCGPQGCPSMGYFADVGRQRGKFYLTTTSKEPFCCDLFDVFRDHVCYGILGCFSNEAPYTNALDELPDSPKEIGVTLTLYTRHDPQRGYALNYTDPKSVLGSSFDPTADTKIIIHGYDNDGTEDWMVNMISQFLKRGPFNVIKVAWGPGAHVFYPQAAANTRVVGAVIAHTLTSLQEVHNISMSSVHLLGHSLGAHIAGYVGERVRGIARISGMDPAGPLFESAHPKVRIDPSDAVFVDCIHSDGVPLKNAGFGTMSAWCDADYYPNGGGLQPGCPKPVSRTLEDVITFKFTDAGVDVSCSHSRSHDYYVDSINTCRFPSTPCTSYDDFTAGKCTCGPQGCPSMGYFADVGKQRGKFYLTTTSTEPFCCK